MSTPSIWSIVLAAGNGSRLAKAGINERKQFIDYQGVPLFWHSLRTFSRIALVRGIMLVVPETELDRVTAWVNQLLDAEPLGMPIVCVKGGARRQDSVYQALCHLPEDCNRVFVHDAARPFFTPQCVHKLLEAVTSDVVGAVPGCAVTDTVKQVHGARVLRTLDRSCLMAVQTPQLFDRNTLQQAHAKALQDNWNVTDDASMVEMMNKNVVVVDGDPGNVKITLPEDLRHLALQQETPVPVSGLGYDVHAYGGNRPMVIGGVPIPGGPDIKAHSDGDVLIHALCDAILGCIGQGDIGDLFPDSDATFENMPSSAFLAEVLDRAMQHGLTMTHVDMTVVAQTPRLSPFKVQIKKNLACLMALPFDRVNLKATTEEGLGFTGTKQGIKAMALVTGTINKPRPVP
ncbi:2-C-methyl-D-erythritol 4-phosphate cytidylyltransferase [Desulfoplanes formicivorans]|uniref:Bifunctional enzyme IspD/IspF n=1 Tax=Desulfoplanes formicivorans TaxID=1592317 RepID=A0A194AHI4_9BACT|nr:2-C-methyl-D-erythritol 4-phosphate cytidylyltransferase [Desulfoplanes formicivorans]GAU09547.1 2-C-methyl-D-erythritol 2,4-cyclodiphosphate synthase [Desulfoplanes formicivorans]